MYKTLLHRPMVWVYFGCVFAYVGSEQGTADWISKFLDQYHGYSPHLTGATTVSWFWGMLTTGCFIGMILFKLFDSRRVLIGFSVGAIAAVSPPHYSARVGLHFSRSQPLGCLLLSCGLRWCR